MILIAPLERSLKVASASRVVGQGEAVGDHLADPHPALLDVWHHPPHLAGRGARADELQLVEDEPLHGDLHADRRDADGGAAAAAAEHLEGPLDRLGDAGALERHVGAEAAGHRPDGADRVAGRGVDRLEAQGRRLRQALRRGPPR